MALDLILRKMKGSYCSIKQSLKTEGYSDDAVKEDLYIPESDVSQGVEGETLRIDHPDGKKDKAPLHLLESIISFTYRSALLDIARAMIRGKIENDNWKFGVWVLLRLVFDSEITIYTGLAACQKFCGCARN